MQSIKQWVGGRGKGNKCASPIQLKCWHVSVRRLHFCYRASKMKNTWEKFLHECGNRNWTFIPGLKLLDPSAVRQSFLQLFSDMSVSRSIPPKQSGGISRLSWLTSCAAWLNKVKEISHLQACVHRFGNGVLVTMVVVWLHGPYMEK